MDNWDNGASDFEGDGRDGREGDGWGARRRRGEAEEEDRKKEKVRV